MPIVNMQQQKARAKVGLAMSEKWYIIEEFGKVGPFSVSELLSGVERGDFDYSIIVESDQSGKRVTLADVASSDQRQSADSTHVVNANRPVGPQVVPTVRTGERQHDRGFVVRQQKGGRRTNERAYVDVRSSSRSRNKNRRSRPTSMLVPAMLLGGVISLGAYYGLKELLQSAKLPKAQVAGVVDLPPDTQNRPEMRTQTGAVDVQRAKGMVNQKVTIGPVTFSRSELYKCRVRCRLTMKGARGGKITAVFFAQAFKRKLLNTSGKVYVNGRIAVNGNEMYLQGLSQH